MREEGSSQMYLKIHRNGREVLVAVCDCDLMGRKFEEGPLHVDVEEDFFGQESACTEDVQKALDRATIANLIGKEAVGCAVRCGLVDENNVLFIAGVPCAQMVRM